MQFGDFFKEKRTALGLSLRQFCQKHNYDPGNISKLERGILTPPQNQQKLDEYAKALSIKKASADYKILLELASTAIEISLIENFFHNISNEKLMERIPLLLKKLDNSHLTEKKLNELIEIASAT